MVSQGGQGRSRAQGQRLVEVLTAILSLLIAAGLALAIRQVTRFRGAEEVPGLIPGEHMTLTNVRMTRYYIAQCRPGPLPVYGLDDSVLDSIDAASMAALRMEGTGDLPNGVRVNYTDGKRWRIVPKGVWGYGVGGRELLPLQSVAVDPKVIPYDSIVHIVELGLHCRAADTGPAIRGQHIDLFTGTEAMNRERSWPDYVTLDVQLPGQF